MEARIGYGLLFYLVDPRADSFFDKFSLFFLRGYENAGLAEGIKYGAMMGVFFCAPNLIFYAVQPLPGILVAQWCFGGLIEITLAGAILASVYRLNET